MDCRLSGELRRPISVVRAGLLILLLSFTGCSRYDVRVYDAPKEKVVARADLPPGWEEGPSGGMRLSSYLVRGPTGEEAQVSVVPLPGASGSELGNVNRWRNQLGLEPIAESDLSSQVQLVTVAGEFGRMFEMSGTVEGKPTRTLAAWLKHADSVWFFKMMGDDALVREQKEAFKGFIAKYELPHDDHSHDEKGP